MELVRAPEEKSKGEPMGEPEEESKGESMVVSKEDLELAVSVPREVLEAKPTMGLVEDLEVVSMEVLEVAPMGA